jgi:tRNA(fMet)-specific endonuclease VapC
MVILDTNIIIEHLRLPPAKKSLLLQIVNKYPKELLGLSIVSVQELYEGRSTRNEAKEKDLLSTITPLKILPFSFEIAKMAGEIARDLDHPIELADAAIAASAIINGCQLATLNQKDFIGIPHLELMKFEPR